METPACTVELCGETLAYSTSGKQLPFPTLEDTQTTCKKQFWVRKHLPIGSMEYRGHMRTLGLETNWLLQVWEIPVNSRLVVITMSNPKWKSIKVQTMLVIMQCCTHWICATCHPGFKAHIVKGWSLQYTLYLKLRPGSNLWPFNNSPWPCDHTAKLSMTGLISRQFFAIWRKNMSGDLPIPFWFRHAGMLVHCSIFCDNLI